MQLSSCDSKHAFERESGNNGSAVSILRERSLRGADLNDTCETSRCLKPKFFSSIVDKTFHNHNQKIL